MENCIMETRQYAPARFILCESRRALAEATATALDSIDGVQCLGVARTYRAARSQLGRQHADVVTIALDFDSDEIEQMAEAAPDTTIAFIADTETLQMRNLQKKCDNVRLVPSDVSLPQLVRLTRNPEEASDTVDNWTPSGLTPRELEVLDLLVKGLNAKGMAAHLHLSIHTARFHIKGLLAKLNVTSQAEAIVVGIRRGLVSPPARLQRS